MSRWLALALSLLAAPATLAQTGLYTVSGGGGVTDHGVLTGLADDDHLQYHTDSRAATWLATVAAGGDLAGTYPSPILAPDVVGLNELAACSGPGELVQYGAGGVPACIATPVGTDDQTAAEVPITDAGVFYTGIEVEAALQEIGADPRWTDARTPTAHAATHGELGSDPVTVTEAQISDLQSYLVNVAEDATPQLGGELDAQGNGIVTLGDVTFQSGAGGGTLRTGTSAADLFRLQAYDTNAGAYRDMLELDAGAVPLMSLFHVTELDIDNGGAIRTGTTAGDTALIQARDVDGASWTTFGTLTAGNTPTFDLASSTTIGGALACLADTSNCPALSAFSGAVTDAQVPDAITVDLATSAGQLEDGDYGDLSSLTGVLSLDDDVVGLAELAACPGPGEIVEYGASGVPACIATPSGGGAATCIDADGDGNCEVRLNGTVLEIDANDDGAADWKSANEQIYSEGNDAALRFNVTSSATVAPFLVTSTTNSGLGGTAQEPALIVSSNSVLSATATRTKIHGAQVNKPSSQTCTDSGDANPGALTLSASGASFIELTSSDPDGCDVTLSETGIDPGHTLKVWVVSHAGGSLSLADTAGVQETGAGCSVTGVHGGWQVDYINSDRWALAWCRASN